MAMSKEDFIKEVESMTVMELNELVKALEEKFGVSAAAPMMVAGAAPAAGARRRAAGRSRPSRGRRALRLSMHRADNRSIPRVGGRSPTAGRGQQGRAVRAFSPTLAVATVRAW